MKRYFATANSTPGAGSATTETVFDIFFIRAFKANRILKTFLFAITFLTLMMVSQNVDAQCACPKPIYPQSVLTPTCTEQSLNVGHRHYYPIQVTAGVWYDIHTCSSNFDSQLGGFNGASCVFFNDNNGPICGGTRASVRWKATFSGNLDVAVRRNFCADIAGIHNAVLSYKISTPTTADAGPDQTVCGTATMAANSPAVGNGDWILISGSGTITSPSNPNTTITNLGVGQNVFQWKIRNSGCSSTDNVTINGNPTETSDAGPDQSVCGTTATLAANAPTSGTGTWSVISGSGTFANANDPTTTVSNLSAGENTFRWTIAGGNCPNSTDEVKITSHIFTTADAGPDQSTCATTAFLSANSPVSGAGAWSVISGSGNFTNANSPTTSVSNLTTGANQFRWTLDNGVCPDSQDDVIITRNSAPVNAVCQDVTIYLDAGGNASITAADVDGGSSSSCGEVLTVNPSSFHCGHIGDNQVSLTVYNNQQQSDQCVAIVTVLDTIPPAIVCPADIIVPNDEDACDAVVNWTPPYPQDNCPMPTLSGTHNSGDTFMAGTTQVIYTSTDASGNSTTCDFLVTVEENEPPVLTPCPANIYNGCSPIVAWIPPTASDNCGVVTLTASHAPGSFFPTGLTTVTYTATDNAGNSVSCSFDVNVVPLPVADAGPDLTICQGDEAIIGGNPTASGGISLGSYTYIWTPSTDLNASNIANPIATPTQDETYQVMVIDNVSGCAGTDEMNITIQAPPVMGVSVINAIRVIMDNNGAFAQPLPPGNTGIVAPDDHFGWEVDRIDDLDGDGLPEAIIGAPRENDNQQTPGEIAYRNGAAYIMHFDANGNPTASYKISNSYGGLNNGGSLYLRDNDQFGMSVTDLGDVDGDGVRDLAVGASGTRRPNDTKRVGAVHILFMNTDNTVKSTNIITDGEAGFPLAALPNTSKLSNSTRYQGYFGFGTSVAGIGDWDNDGISELAVGNMTGDDNGSNRGEIWILFLDSTGSVKTNGAKKISDPDLKATMGGSNVLANQDFFGASVDAIGDVNADGTTDLIVGAPGDNDGPTNPGAVYILFMNADGTLLSHTKISATTGVNTTALPLESNDFWGFAVSEAGDIDGDGTPDVWVGCYLDNNPAPGNKAKNKRGAIYQLFLQADGQVSDWHVIDGDPGTYSGVLAGQLTDDDYFGKGITLMHDYDGDCVNSILVGAHREDETQTNLNSSTENEGAVWMLHLGDVALAPKMDETTTEFQAIEDLEMDVEELMLTSKSNSNEVLNIDFNIYPNPTTGLLKVALPPSATTDANTSIQVLDVMGRQIFLMENVSQNQSEIAIDLTKENPGIYYLEVKNGEKSTAKSFVLTR